jgi:CMP/dCMP kinase
MLITIDGPAGAGKSSVAKLLAKRLGFRFLDTGAMYRAVALAGMHAGLDWDMPSDLAELARHLRLRVEGERIFLDGEDVSEAIRTTEVTAVTRYAADNPAVRSQLVELQRRTAAGQDIVTEGRDQGTVAFPDADCKFYLMASPEERARRRLNELAAKNQPVTLEQVLAAQNRRDREDSSRSVGPLLPADDAIEISTDGLSLDAVVEKLEAIVREKMKESATI